MAIKSFEGQPYFDDYFNEGASGNRSPRDKNYVRVLFQPGVSVQVRELNQIQSTLQNQIDQFGRSVYKDGTPVIDGLTSYDPNVYYVDIDITDVDLIAQESYISQLNLLGDNTNTTTSDLTAEILGYQKVYDQTGAAGVIYRFYLRYLKADGSAAGPETQIFSASETIYNLNAAAIQTPTDETIIGFGDTLGTVERVGYASAINVEEGVFFINGNFIVVDKTSIFISKTSKTQEFDGSINWQVTENTITANEDVDLLDNAAGTPNEVAPGAHRYQISLALKFLTSDTTIIGNTISGNTTTQNNPNVLADTTTGQFVNLLNVSTDKALLPARTEYTQLDRKFAERTFEESGNYTVKPFQLDLREYLNDGAGNRGKYTTAEITALNTAGDITLGSDTETEFGEKRFIVGLEPSTAYVSGYRIELNEKVEIPVLKARDTETTTNLEVSATIGGYVFGDFVSSVANAELFDPTAAETATANIEKNNAVIGNCKLRTIEKVNTEKYQLYIYDINITDADKSLADADKIHQNEFEFEPLRDDSNNLLTFELQNASESNAIIQLPVTTVASVSVASVKGRKLFTNLDGTTPQLGTLDSGDSFYSDAVSDYVLLEDDGTDVDLNSTPTGTGGQTLTLDLQSDIGPTGNAGSAIAPYEDTNLSITQKAIAETGGTPVAITNTGVSSGGYITLTGYYDLINVTKLEVDAGAGFVTVPESDYVLDNGQRDNYYDEARIQYIGTADYSAGTTDWKVSFRYWNWTSTGDFATVNSYNNAATSTYIDIPTYKNDKLSDVIDFRQKKGIGAVFPLDPSGLIEISSMDAYNGRIDKVVVNNIGEFSVVKGTPSSNPQPPIISEDRMALYELSVPGFTEEAADITPKYLDNRRYTMKDIGSLARRIKNVEYYTSLSLLEKETLDKDIFTAAGDQRFKNGVLVDSFFGHNIGNPIDTDYACSIDASRGILRPQFEMNDTLLKATTVGEVNSDIIQLDFTETALIDQPLASISESVNPFDLADWQGHVTLTPTTDEWKETNQRPDIVINDTSAYDQFAQMAQEQNLLGTIWDEWEVAWRGTTTETRNIQIGRHDGSHDPTGQNRAAKAELGFTNWRPIKGQLTETITNTTEVRSGIRRTLDYFDHTINAGERIVDVSFVPFIRSRRINFEAKLMKPNTRLYVYFDGKNVSDYCTAISDMSGGGTFADVTHSSAMGQAVATFKDRELTDLQSSELSTRHELISDDNGILRGSLIIPNNDEFRFRTGERTFKLTDSQQNQDAEQTTSAQATYNASGLIESKSNAIITTRIPQFNEQRLTDVRNSSVVTDRDTSKVRYYDPLAQSFIIGDYQNGVYATGIELYFQKKHSTIPVRTHLVTVENGIPTQKVIPGTEVILNPSDVQASVDGAGTNATQANTATLFTYDQPVYLQPGVEYAIVVLSNSPEYRLWLAETGGTDNVTLQKISKNPYAGVSFKSQNASTWTPNQNRDFKFKIKKAVYSSSKVVDFQTQFNGNVTQIDLDTAGSGYSSAPTVTISAPANGGTQAIATATISGGAVNTLTLVNPGSGYTEIPTISFSGGSPTVAATASATLNTYSNSYFRLLAEEVKLPNTDITYVYGTSNTTPSKTLIANQNVNIDSANQLVGGLSVGGGVNNNVITVRATLTTSDTNISPQIDTQRFSLLSIYNLVNDPATAKIVSGNTGDFASVVNSDDTRVDDDFSYLTDTGLSSVKMSYITRSVVLNSPADRVNIFLAANRPTINTNIRVLIKLRVGEEDYDSVPWYEIKPTAAIPVTPEGVFREIEFDFDPELLGASDSRKSIEFNAFAVRVISTTTDHRIIPTIKDFRAIATFS
jgi:hypothetical protein